MLREPSCGIGLAEVGQRFERCAPDAGRRMPFTEADEEIVAHCAAERTRELAQQDDTIVVDPVHRCDAVGVEIEVVLIAEVDLRWISIR